MKKATIYNASTGAVTVSGGKVQTTGDANITITNAATGADNVDGGVVQATGEISYTIYNFSTGTATVSGGKVLAAGTDSYAIGNGSTGKITISGTDTVVTSDNQDDTQGTIVMYEVPSSGDKFILDIQEATVSNTANPEGDSVRFASSSSVTTDNVTDYYKKDDKATLRKVSPAPIPVEIANSNRTNRYATLADAFAAAADGDTLKVNTNIDLGTTGVTLSGNKGITLNLNGYTVTHSGTSRASAIKLNDSASLIVTDTTSEKKGKLEVTGLMGYAINNTGSGEVKVTSGTVQATGMGGVALRNSSTGVVTVSGGTVRERRLTTIIVMQMGPPYTRFTQRRKPPHQPYPPAVTLPPAAGLLKQARALW